MKNEDSTTTIQQLKDLVVTFREQRSWGTHHTPKNLAMSIAIEAAELMEHFQWDEYGQKDQAELADELADILIFCLNFAETVQIDVASSFRSKLARAEKKYPVELFNESSDDEADYIRIKKAYREKKDKF
jgi:dCTP diphosphatase